MQRFNRITVRAFTFLLPLVLAGSVAAQSTSQEYPTPVTSNEISAAIAARDVGDSRLTSFYYQFDSSQGDLFLNVVTRNFAGDIDVFTVSGLRPLTKIVIYADVAETETGRVIYFRKPERMILRVQGRTPGDDAASLRIKFAGSFVASTQAAPLGEPALPNVTAKNDSGIRVNSVGTIVEVIPKATPIPPPESTVAEERQTDAERGKDPDEKKEPASKVDGEEKAASADADEPVKKVEVVVTDNIPAADATNSPPVLPPTRGRGRRRTPPKTVAATGSPDETTAGAAKTTQPMPGTRRGRTPPKTTTPKEPDPLEKINLVILFKDGTRMERPMSEVLRFTVDKGVLTVIAKDGSIGRYSILDVERVTIE